MRLYLLSSKPLLIFFLSFLILGCAKNPVTKRYELMLFSNSAEIRIGKKAHPTILKEFGGEYKKADLEKYVERVGQKVAMCSDRTNIPYHFTVLDSPIINAFALPGGYIYITRGLLAYINNEAQLACVLGHEIGHVCARHGVKRLQNALGANLLLVSVSIATGSELWVRISDLLIYTVMQGYSRANERQADELGTLYAFRAGYDPTQMPKFLSILRDLYGGDMNLLEAIWADHPQTKERIKNTEKEAQNLIKGIKKSLYVGRDEYISHLCGVEFGYGKKGGIISNNRYTNGYFGIEIYFPKRFHIKHARRGNRIIAESKNSIITLCMYDLDYYMSSIRLCELFEKRNRLRRVFGIFQKISGKNCFVAKYQIKGERLDGLKAAYIAYGKKGIILLGECKAKEFLAFDPIFDSTLYSLRFLTKEEAERVPVYRIKVYRVKREDTLSSISYKFYGSKKFGKQILKFNGLSKIEPGILIKIKPKPFLSEDN